MYRGRASVVDCLSSLGSSSCCSGVGGDTRSHELVEGVCSVEQTRCVGGVEELGASSASARLMTRPRRMSTGVDDGSRDEADSVGRHCPGLVSVHFCTERELVGCSCAVCGATVGRTVKHFSQRVLEMPLRQCLLQKCL